jgi:hypothetical protein
MAAQNDRHVFKLRQQLMTDQTVGELARGVQETFNRLNPVTYKKVRSFYNGALPIVLGVFSAAPLCIELVRITSVVQADVAVSCSGGGVPFVYKPKQGGALVGAIYGLSTTRAEYDFVFRITFEASNG